MDWGQVNPSCWVIIDGEQLCCHISERINGWWCLKKYAFQAQGRCWIFRMFHFSADRNKELMGFLPLPGDLSVKSSKLQRTKTEIEKLASCVHEWWCNDDKWRVDFSELIYPNTKYIQKTTTTTQKQIRCHPPTPYTHVTHTSPSCRTGKCDSRQDFTHKPSSVDMSWLTGKGRRVRRGTKELDKIPSSCCPPRLFFLFGEDFQVSAARLRLRPRSTAQTVGGGEKEKDNSQAKRHLLFNSCFLFLRLQASCRHPRSLANAGTTFRTTALPFMQRFCLIHTNERLPTMKLLAATPEG